MSGSRVNEGHNLALSHRHFFLAQEIASNLLLPADNLIATDLTGFNGLYYKTETVYLY